MNDFLTLLLVFVELNVQNLPVTYTDTGMAALMAMFAIVTTKVLHLTLMVDSDFINITPYLSHHIWSRVRIIYGGCCISEDDPEWQCSKCGAEIYDAMHIPYKKKDAFAKLDAMLSEEDKKEMTKGDSYEYHFTLGTWIRNNWIYEQDDKTSRVNLTLRTYLKDDDLVYYNMVVEGTDSYLVASF